MTMHCTKSELADMLGLTVRRVTDLIATKVIPPAIERGRYDVAGSVKGYVAFLRSNAKTLADERARLVRIRADLMQLRYRREAGELVEVQAVEREAFNSGRRIRDGMQNIPDRMCGILAAESDQHKVHSILAKEIFDVLTTLSQDRFRRRDAKPE
jgi:phage terminase Nu1 subunit (DNA packaging protein)